VLEDEVILSELSIEQGQQIVVHLKENEKFKKLSIESAETISQPIPD